MACVQNGCFCCSRGPILFVIFIFCLTTAGWSLSVTPARRKCPKRRVHRSSLQFVCSKNCHNKYNNNNEKAFLATGVFTIEFAAHQLQAQRAGPAANHRDDADVLGHDGRVKKVGLGAVVVRVANENLRRATKRELGERPETEKPSGGEERGEVTSPCPSAGPRLCTRCKRFHRSRSPP